jgi:hypothetical protein
MAKCSPSSTVLLGGALLCVLHSVALAQSCPAGTPTCTTVFGSNCIAQSYDSVVVTGDVYSTSSQINFTDGASVVCPVVKTTSGPGRTSGDDLLSVTMSLTVPKNGSVTCNLYVYDSTYTSTNGYNNTLRTYPGSVTSQAGTSWTVSFKPYPGQAAAYNFWNTGHPDWLYSEIECTAANLTWPNFVNLNGYSTAENGTQLESRIYPSSSCKFDTGHRISSVGSYSMTETPAGGGLVESNAPIDGSGTQFEWDCAGPLDANHNVDWSFVPSNSASTTLASNDGSLVHTILPVGGALQSLTFSAALPAPHNDATYFTSSASGDFMFLTSRTH